MHGPGMSSITSNNEWTRRAMTIAEWFYNVLPLHVIELRRVTGNSAQTATAAFCMIWLRRRAFTWP